MLVRHHYATRVEDMWPVQARVKLMPHTLHSSARVLHWASAGRTKHHFAHWYVEVQRLQITGWHSKDGVLKIHVDVSTIVVLATDIALLCDLV